MVRNEEPFLPPHENGTTIAIRHGELRSFELILDVAEGREAVPVHHIFLFVGAPFLGQEAITIAYDFRVKVGCQLRPIVGQSAYTEVPAEEGRGKVDVLVGKIS